MVSSWDRKGCSVCRDLWRSGQQPPEIGKNETMHARLHRCATCGTLWQQTERYVDVIDKSEAEALFPEAFNEGRAHVDTHPSNALEESLQQAQSGRTSIAEFIQTMLASDLVVPSAAEISGTGEGFRPILFRKGPHAMVACFTSEGRVGTFSDMAPYLLQINGREFFARMPQDCGLVLNPGHRLGLEMSPKGVSSAVRDFPPAS